MRRWASQNGDGPLRPDQRLAYLFLNAIDNRFPYRHLDPGLRIADFRCDEAMARLDDLAGTPSPSRAISDLFWMHLPWGAIASDLGALHVLDLGCGSGRYGERLAAWSGERVERYVGVDLSAHRDWVARSATHSFIEFKAGDIEELDRFISPGTNLIISQSTLEHVADDFRALDHIHTYAHHCRRPLLQIHLVPSAACLRLYLWHGYRQYTPRTLASLTTRFADCSERLLVRLGGDACNALHQRFITWPVLIRRAADARDLRPAEYRYALAAAIAHDMRRPQRSPAFYALLIHSNVRTPVLTSGCWRDAAA